MADTSQDRGYQWDRELARRIGGKAHEGSGNRVYSKLDAGVAGEIVISGKHTDAESFRVTPDMVDEVLRSTLGPEGMTGHRDGFIAVHCGDSVNSTDRAVAVVDLDLLLRWLTAPPEIIQATPMDSIRATARTPPFLRND